MGVRVTAGGVVPVVGRTVFPEGTQAMVGVDWAKVEVGVGVEVSLVAQGG